MQPKQSTYNEYAKRINVVVEYINNNLDGKIDLETLSSLSNFSPYYFHRIMRAFLGESVGAYITRIRVETAARLLRYSSLPIQEIAFNVGYDTPSSLTKVFKQYYTISPSEYRNNKTYTIMKPLEMNENLKLKTPRVLNLEPKQAIYLRFVGKYSEVDYPEAWRKLWAFVKANKLYSAGMEHIAIYHDDPKVTESDKLRTDICLVVHKPVKPEGDVGIKEIPGGRYVVFHYQGPYTNLGMVYDTIFGKYLPEGNYKLRNLPMFEKYLNDPSNTDAEKLKTEIFIPIE